MSAPSVTIVTPVYNQASFLPETIDSVLAQDHPNLEYIVLDDGSTDDTPRILEQYGDQIVHHRHENMGQAKTLNRGWGMARGAFLGYLSADDLLFPEAISRLSFLLEHDSSIACVFPDAHLIDEQARVIKKNVCRPFDLAELVVRQECHIGPGALFRRSDYELVGGWQSDLRLAPDREFWIRLASQGRIQMCEEVLASYRMHRRSISYRDVSEDVSREYIRVLDDYFCGVSVPADIAARRDEAYGYAHLLVARNCFRAGRIQRGVDLYGLACKLHADLRGWRVKLRLFRNAISRPVRTALSRIQTVVGRLRRRV